MKQRFRKGYRYTADGTEHPGSCRCNRCQDFESFIEKQCPGLLQTRTIKGKEIKVAFR
jgi:hypothetical protein